MRALLLSATLLLCFASSIDAKNRTRRFRTPAPLRKVQLAWKQTGSLKVNLRGAWRGKNNWNSHYVFATVRGLGGGKRHAAIDTSRSNAEHRNKWENYHDAAQYGGPVPLGNVEIPREGENMFRVDEGIALDVPLGDAVISDLSALARLDLSPENSSEVMSDLQEVARRMPAWQNAAVLERTSRRGRPWYRVRLIHIRGWRRQADVKVQHHLLFVVAKNLRASMPNATLRGFPLGIGRHVSPGLVANGAFRGHQLGGKVVVPGAAYVDAIAQSLAEHDGTATVELEDVKISTPLPLEKTPTEVTTQIESEGRSDITISSQRGTHASAKRAKNAFPKDALAGLAAVKRNQGTPLATRRLYRFFQKKLGLRYRGAFRDTLKGIRIVNARTATGVLRLPKGVEGHAMHPAVLDSAFHLVAALRVADGGENPLAAVPAKFGKVWVDTAATLRPGQDIVAKLEITTPGKETERGLLKFNLWIGRYDGSPLLMMEGATLIRVNPERLVQQ